MESAPGLPHMSSAHDNPFRTSRLLTLPVHWGGDSPERLLARWHAAGRRGALVGPHGTGKTTRLRALAALLVAEGWEPLAVQWHDDGTATPANWRALVRAAGPRTLLLLDGSENLGVLGALRLFAPLRRAGGVLATLHRRSLFLPTLANHAPSAETFLSHAESLAPGSGEAARRTFAAARGNAHEAFRQLYLEHAAFSSVKV